MQDCAARQVDIQKKQQKVGFFFLNSEMISCLHSHGFHGPVAQ